MKFACNLSYGWLASRNLMNCGHWDVLFGPGGSNQSCPKREVKKPSLWDFRLESWWKLVWWVLETDPIPQPPLKMCVTMYYVDFWGRFAHKFVLFRSVFWCVWWSLGPVPFSWTNQVLRIWWTNSGITSSSLSWAFPLIQVLCCCSDYHWFTFLDE